MSQPASRDPLEAGCLPDAESQGWLRALSATGPERGDARERLHALLLRVARFEVVRRRAGADDGLDDLAVQVAGDALVAVMRSLHSYSGDSRFTSWASKFALVETAVQLRRRGWQGRDLPPEADGWTRLLEGHADVPRQIEDVHEAAVALLAPYERAVLVASRSTTSRSMCSPSGVE